MGFIQFNEKLVSRPKNGTYCYTVLKRKSLDLANARPMSLFSTEFFNKFFTARESNDRQTFKWMNSIKFRVSETLHVSNSKPMHQCHR